MASQDAAYDVTVIGGGPGGYVAAIRAAQLGCKVAVIEKADLGGICANWGCIPTKALLHAAEVYSSLKDGAALGIVADGLRIDFAQMIASSRAAADGQKKGVAYLLKKNRIAHIQGAAVLEPADTGAPPPVRVGGEVVRSRHVIVATGARPRGLPGLMPDGEAIITYFEAMNLPAQPRELVVIGAGAIGVEFAYFYNAIGTKVTLIEALPRILPIEDDEISGLLQRSLQKQGIQVVTGAKVQGVDRPSGTAGVIVRYTDAAGQGGEARGDRVLSAVGVQGNVEGLGLEACGIKSERGFIQVDEWYRALSEQGPPVPGVYAIGDVVGPPMLAHKASAEGVACVEKIAGVAERDIHRVHYGAIPGATFCRPEVGSMGLTEAQARQQGREVLVGKFPFKASGKGQAAHATEGLVKTVVDKHTGEILGAHILGGTASDLIATLTLARSAELTATEVIHTVFAHPTFAEIIKGSVEAAYGEAIDL